MKYEIVEIDRFSGKRATVYAIKIEGEDETLFEEFIRRYDSSHPDETEELLKTIERIGNKTGAREHFFKLNEGKPGDGVCALYDNNKHLRLYCIRYGAIAIILGGGSKKPKHIKAWQDDEQLTKQVELIQKISQDISERIKLHEIKWSKDGMFLEGELKFSIE